MVELVTPFVYVCISWNKQGTFPVRLVFNRLTPVWELVKDTL